LPHGVYRALCAAALCALIAVAVDVSFYRRAFRSDVLVWGGLGLLAGPLAWLERQAGPDGWRSRLCLGLWTLAGALVGAWLIGLQSAYSEGFLSHATWSLAMEAAQDGAWLAAFDPLTPVVLVVCAAPFAMTPLLRRSGRSPWLLALAGGFTTLAVARPLLRAVDAWGHLRQVVVVHTAAEVIPTWGLPSGPQATVAMANAPAWTVARYLIVMAFLVGAALPLAYALADRLVERWAWDDDLDHAPPEPSRLPWVVVAGACVLLVALGLHTRAHPSQAQVVRWLDFAQQGGRLSLAARALERIDASDHAMAPALLKELRSKQDHRRRWAARLLGRIGPRAREAAYEPVLAATQDVEPQVAVEALRALGRMQAHEAIEPLIEVFMLGGGGVASQAAEASLGDLEFRWGREHVEQLLSYFGSHGWRVERQSLRILGQLGPEAEAAVVPLTELLAVYGGGSRRTRWYGQEEIFEALAAIGAPTLAEARRRLEAPSGEPPGWEMAIALVGSLGRMPPSRAVWDTLATAAGHAEAEVRRAAAFALDEQLETHGSRLPEPLHADSVALLLAFAADEQAGLRGGLEGVRSWAVPHLLARLQGEGEQRALVVKALGSMSRRNRRIDEALLGAAADADPALRIAAAEALGLRFRGDHEALHALAGQDPDPGVRRAALMALAGGGAERSRVRKRLREALEDETLTVRVEAALLLAGRRWFAESRHTYVARLTSADQEALSPFLPRLIAVLVEALRQPEAVHGRDHTVELLTEIGRLAEPVVLPALAKVVTDGALPLEIRVRAAEVLHGLGTRAAGDLRRRLAEEAPPGALRARLSER
jgi:HEAT repeat protein